MFLTRTSDVHVRLRTVRGEQRAADDVGATRCRNPRSCDDLEPVPALTDRDDGHEIHPRQSDQLVAGGGASDTEHEATVGLGAGEQPVGFADLAAGGR